MSGIFLTKNKPVCEWTKKDFISFFKNTLNVDIQMKEFTPDLFFTFLEANDEKDVFCGHKLTEKNISDIDQFLQKNDPFAYAIRYSYGTNCKVHYSENNGQYIMYNKNDPTYYELTCCAENPRLKVQKLLEMFHCDFFLMNKRTFYVPDLCGLIRFYQNFGDFDEILSHNNKFLDNNFLSKTKVHPFPDDGIGHCCYAMRYNQNKKCWECCGEYDGNFLWESANAQNAPNECQNYTKKDEMVDTSHFKCMDCFPDDDFNAVCLKCFNDICSPKNHKAAFMQEGSWFCDHPYIKN